MQDYLDILGLASEPQDMKTVKRAYAAKLKVTRPDDDPEGFMLLRAAYDWVRSDLAWRLENQNDQTERNIDLHEPVVSGKKQIAIDEKTASDREQNDQIEIAVSENDSDQAKPEYGQTYEISVEPNVTYGDIHSFELPAAKSSYSPPLTDDTIALLDDPKRRNEASYWRDLFSKARTLSVDDYCEFEDGLRRNLLQYFGYYNNDESRSNQNHKPKIISPHITNSLFKTMEWHKIMPRDYMVQHEIDWLAEDLGLTINKPTQNASVEHSADSSYDFSWLWVIAVIIGFQVIRALTDFI